MSQYLTEQQAAELAGVQRQAIQKARARGQLPFTQVYGRVVIERGDVITYRDEQGRRNGARKKKEASGTI